MSVGKYGLTPMRSFNAPEGILTDMQDVQEFALPKDPGTVTLYISMKAYKPQPVQGGTPPTDTIRDTLTLKIEAPTINSFTIKDLYSNGPASPFWFGTVANQNPSATGTSLGLVLASGNPVAKKWVGMFANITNTTHYDLSIGVAQILDHIDYSMHYTNNVLKIKTGDNVLDLMSDNLHINSYWYGAQRIRVNAGSSNYDVPTGDGLVDSPDYILPASLNDAKGNVGWLDSFSLNFQFSTHLIVSGGWIPAAVPGPMGPDGGVDGYPIGLSTAKWHVYGSALNNWNSQSPTTANLVTTTTISNWTVAATAGPGALTGPIVGVSTATWTSSGDGVRKYLTWSMDVNTFKQGSIVFPTTAWSHRGRVHLRRHWANAHRGHGSHR